MPVEDDATLRAILAGERVAVVGASRSPRKDAHRIPRYLVDQGYDVVPVNPNAERIFDRPAVDTLGDVSGPIDIVDVFRPSDEVAGIVDAAIDRGDVGTIWLQLGIHDDDAVRRAEAAGITVVQDRCIMIAHRELSGDHPDAESAG